MKKLFKADLDYLQWGATFCSSGGGGGWNNTEQIKKNLLNEMKKAGTDHIEMVDFADLPNDAVGCVVGAVGRPDILGGLGDNLAASLERVVPNYVGTGAIPRVDFVLAVEIGANTFIAMIAALRLGVPIVNCDGARRAVPAITDLTYTANGISVNPLVVANISSATLPPTSNEICEPTVEQTSQVLRKIISQPTYSGGIATLASWGVDIQALAQPGAAIEGSISFAIELGAVAMDFLASNPVDIIGMVDEINEFLDPNRSYPQPICNTVVAGNVESTPGPQPPGGWDSGTVAVKDLGSFVTWDVNFLNENITLVPQGSGQSTPSIMYPDLIIYIGGDGNPTTNADPINEGDSMVIMTVPADPILRFGATPCERAQLDAAASFVRGKVGYDGPYVANPSFSYSYPKVT